MSEIKIPDNSDEAAEKYAHVLTDLVWYSHLPVRMVVLVEKEGAFYWEAEEVCPYYQLGLSNDATPHAYSAGNAIDLVHTLLGKTRCDCDEGDVVILSQEALEYVQWVRSLD